LTRRNASTASAAELQLRLACEICGERPRFVERCVREWFQERPLRHLKRSLHPNLVDLLAQAKRQGIRLGILSDYPAKEKLAALGIGEYFDAVVSSQDREVGLLKPHPRGLLNCVQRLDVEPGRCIYIGDRVDVDLPCAMNARTRFVLFGNAPIPAHCKAVSSYRQLIDTLGFET